MDYWQIFLIIQFKVSPPPKNKDHTNLLRIKNIEEKVPIDEDFAKKKKMTSKNVSKEFV